MTWPLTFEEDAPWFAATYVGFDTFFDTIDILDDQAGALDLERIEWACCYAGAKSESWELVDAFSEPNATFATFRDQVCTLYPKLDPVRCFSYRDLEVLVQRMKTCSDMTLDEFGQYSRDFATISTYLKKWQHLSDNEQGCCYLEGFPPPIHSCITYRLKFTKPDIVPADGYDFKDICDATSVVFNTGGSSYQPLTITPTSSPISSSDQSSLQDILQAMSSMAQSLAVAPQQWQQPFTVYPPQPPSISLQKSSTVYPSPPSPHVPHPSAPRACVFCSAPDHRIWDCLIASKYCRQGKITCNEHGKVMLPDGRLPSRNELGRNLQEKVDYFWELQNIHANDNQSCTRATMHFLEVQNEHASVKW